MSHQERIHNFLADRQLLDLDAQVEKLSEEDWELWEALATLQTDGSDEALEAAAMEAVDGIIVRTGIVDILGFNADELVDRKLTTTEVKYSLDDFKVLIDQGMSPTEARSIIKEFWKETELIRLGRY